MLTGHHIDVLLDVYYAECRACILDAGHLRNMISLYIKLVAIVYLLTVLVHSRYYKEFVLIYLDDFAPYVRNVTSEICPNYLCWVDLLPLADHKCVKYTFVLFNSE